MTGHGCRCVAGDRFEKSKNTSKVGSDYFKGKVGVKYWLELYQSYKGPYINLCQIPV